MRPPPLQSHTTSSSVSLSSNDSATSASRRRNCRLAALVQWTSRSKRSACESLGGSELSIGSAASEGVGSSCMDAVRGKTVAERGAIESAQSAKSAGSSLENDSGLNRFGLERLQLRRVLGQRMRKSKGPRELRFPRRPAQP